jgi:hypothetical protein
LPVDIESSAHFADISASNHAAIISRAQRTARTLSDYNKAQQVWFDGNHQVHLRQTVLPFWSPFQDSAMLDA